MSNNKLTNEEIAAFLDNFDAIGVSYRKLLEQKPLFIMAFCFTNVYVIFYLLTHTLFTDAMSVQGMEKLKEDFGILLGIRSAISLLLLCLFNMAFFFTNYFRFIATVGLAYLTNATLDVVTIFAHYLDLSSFSAAAIFYRLRPVSLLAILCCILSFDPER